MAAESLHQSTTRALTASPPFSLARFALGLCFVCLLVFGIAPRLNSPALAADTAPAAAPAATTSTGNLSRQDAEQLLSVLNDPKKRQDFTNTLTLMAKGLPVAQPAAAPAAKKPNPTAVIDSDVNSELSGLTTSMRGYTQNFTALFKDLRSVGTWFHQQISNPQSRQTLIDAFSRALIIMLVALALERATSLLLKKPLNSVTAHAETRERKQEAAVAVENVQAATSTPDGDNTKTRAMTSAAAMRSCAISSGFRTIFCIFCSSCCPSRSSWVWGIWGRNS